MAKVPKNDSLLADFDRLLLVQRLTDYVNADPRTSTVPDVSPATVTATDSSPASAAAQSHGLTNGAKAGIAIGAIAGAVLAVALAALAFTKVSMACDAVLAQLHVMIATSPSLHVSQQLVVHSWAHCGSRNVTGKDRCCNCPNELAVTME